jgi:hypothetical protein
MTQVSPTDIIIGVDTHKHTHAAVASTGLGARVAELTIKVGSMSKSGRSGVVRGVGGG